MSTHLPELTQFCAKLAKLHASTYSLTGKFGYHVARDMAKRKRQIQIEDVPEAIPAEFWAVGTG